MSGKSNQQNLGTIRSSNLCTEIVEYTAPDEVAVCNLASIVIPSFVSSPRQPKVSQPYAPDPAADPKALLEEASTETAEEASFDFNGLYRVSKIITKNLNKIIDRNEYPIPEAENSNKRHR